MSHQTFIELFNKGKESLSQWRPQTKIMSEATFDVIDFFCCGGGMSLGFASLRESFRILGGVDINSTSLKTYELNYGTHVLNADITTISPESSLIQQTFKLKKNRPLIVIGCAPCQGFSAHRKKYGDKPEDERNTLIGYFSDIAVNLNPDFVVMENVPEILTGKYKNHYEEAKKIFTKNGYYVVQRVYNAAGFGVPQARCRAIIVASKYKNFVLPDELLFEEEYKTVRDAIADLPYVDARSQTEMADIYHRCSTHKQSTIDVIAQVPHNGGSRPKGVGPKCLDKVNGFSDVYGRLSWDKPSITITQYARNPASGRYSHPEQNRGLTMREAARLQSFPDGYLWNGSLGDVFKQIGEAVPPLLALAIATQIVLTIKE